MGRHGRKHLIEGNEGRENKLVNARVDLALEASYELLDAVLVVQRIQYLPDELKIELDGLNVLRRRLKVL